MCPFFFFNKQSLISLSGKWATQLCLALWCVSYMDCKLPPQEGKRKKICMWPTQLQYRGNDKSSNLLTWRLNDQTLETFQPWRTKSEMEKKWEQHLERWKHETGARQLFFTQPCYHCLMINSAKRNFPYLAVFERKKQCLVCTSATKIPKYL